MNIARSILPVIAAAFGMAVLGAAAQAPSALAEVKPGMWELTGIPGSSAPQRLCIADLDRLVRFEHRSQNCTSNVISDEGRSTVIGYSCGAAGFGRTRIDVVTPRNIKVGTQGISGQLPFNYTLTARRVGDCAK
ncbi:MAG: DUF3617 family protein [Sphingomicrobium sp.]